MQRTALCIRAASALSGHRQVISPAYAMMPEKETATVDRQYANRSDIFFPGLGFFLAHGVGCGATHGTKRWPPTGSKGSTAARPNSRRRRRRRLRVTNVTSFR